MNWAPGAVPEPGRICLGRLAGGGGLISDTCNTAQKTMSLLQKIIIEEAREMIGAEVWDAMGEAEQKHATRVHRLECWQHMRNIFLKHMSSAQAKHATTKLKPWLETFGSWERMSTEFDALLRGVYKEFHIGNAYYKGKGRGEFWAWLANNHPKAFIVFFERAEGGRQDLDYDAAIPLCVMRAYNGRVPAWPRLRR